MSKARWVLVAGVIVALAAVISVIVMLVSSAELSDDSRTEGELAGIWVSENPDAPGTLILNADGSLQARGLSIFDDWKHDPTVKLASDLDAPGRWHLTRDLVFAEFEDGARKLTVSYLVMSSPFRGLSIQGIVGDPDAPELLQVFRRVE